MLAASELQILALKLPQGSRLKLAVELLRSVPGKIAITPSEALQEAERRDEELENGSVIPLDEASFWKGTVSRRSRL